LIENGTATSEQIEAIWAGLRADIEAAIAFAEDSPLPDPGQVLVDVYTGGLQ
jgi:pyruvate dehydrogenase E1 component alpha subunit